MTKRSDRAQPEMGGRDGPILAAALVWIARGDDDVMSLQAVTEAPHRVSFTESDRHQQAG